MRNLTNLPAKIEKKEKIKTEHKHDAISLKISLKLSIKYSCNVQKQLKN